MKSISKHGPEPPEDRAKHITIDQDWEQQIFDWIPQNADNYTSLGRKTNQRLFPKSISISNHSGLSKFVHSSLPWQDHPRKKCSSGRTVFVSTGGVPRQNSLGPEWIYQGVNSWTGFLSRRGWNFGSGRSRNAKSCLVVWCCVGPMTICYQMLLLLLLWSDSVVNSLIRTKPSHPLHSFVKTAFNSSTDFPSTNSVTAFESCSCSSNLARRGWF
jgi:hypothetical protein